jgi:hypothetical protein
MERNRFTQTLRSYLLIMMETCLKRWSIKKAFKPYTLAERCFTFTLVNGCILGHLRLKLLEKWLGIRIYLTSR